MRYRRLQQRSAELKGVGPCAAEPRQTSRQMIEARHVRSMAGRRSSTPGPRPVMVTADKHDRAGADRDLITLTSIATDNDGDRVYRTAGIRPTGNWLGDPAPGR